MSSSTVLIFTANDPNQMLPSLSEEAKSIQRILNSNAGKNYETALIPDATINDIIEEFKVPDRAIEIIHYAGHADDQTLRFSDNDADASALAAKIKSHGQVKIVFLNGCATKDQVQYFQAAGVPFVIATSRPIEDKRASWMATQFYQYLTLKRSTKKAMEEVVIDAQKLTKQIAFSNERGIGLLQSDTPDHPFEWGLYILADVADTDYALPVSAFAKASETEISNTSFLNKLVFALEKTNSNNISGIKKLASDLQRGYKVTDKKKAAELLKVLPYPLGIRLRQIVADPVDRNEDYFRQLMFDYVVFFETLLFQTIALLLAQIWQDKEEAIKYKPEQTTLIRSFLRENRILESFDSYTPLIQLSLNWIKQYNPSSEIPIESSFIQYLKSPEFKTTADFFYLHKQYYWQHVRMSEAEAIENCFMAQIQLSNVLPYFSFIVKYTLASIREINVMNFRHLPNNFDNIENVVSKLVVNEVEPSPISGQLKLENMMENRTVLSFYDSDPEIGHTSLNLFPFIIDRNVYAGEPNSEVDLYMFVGFFAEAAEKEPCYHFASVNNPGKIWLFDDQNLTEVSFLHRDEQTSLVHKHNHLMTNAWEFKNYLDQYRDFILKL